MAQRKGEASRHLKVFEQMLHTACKNSRGKRRWLSCGQREKVSGTIMKDHRIKKSGESSFAGRSHLNTLRPPAWDNEDCGNQNF